MLTSRTRSTLPVIALLALCGGAQAAQPDAAATPNDQVRALVSEVLADSETRSSLLASGDAGHDSGFFLAGDGFRLQVGGALQFRYMANFRDDSNVDDFESGFQNRRTLLTFGGVVHEKFAYYIQANFDKDDGTFGLEDAYAAYAFDCGWKLIGGQVKAPFLRETLMTEWHQLAAEPSMAEAFFGGGRTQAIAIAKEAEDWSFVFAFSDGAFADNTDFTAFNGISEADYSLTPRFQYKFSGDWKQFADFTSPRGSDFAAMAGAALHFQQSRNTNDPADTDVQLFRYTLDLSLEGDGWNAFGAFYGSHVALSTTGPSDPADLDDFGGVVQGGVHITDMAEIFARWDGIFVDDDRGFDEDAFHFITAGLNYYWAGHAVKGTLDAIYSVNKTADLVGSGTLPNTNIGLLGDSDEGEITLRAQFQLLF